MTWFFILAVVLIIGGHFLANRYGQWVPDRSNIYDDEFKFHPVWSAVAASGWLVLIGIFFFYRMK